MPDAVTVYIVYRVGLSLSDSRGGALLGAACYAAAATITARSVRGLEVASGLRQKWTPADRDANAAKRN